MLSMIKREWHKLRTYVLRVFHMQRIHTMLDIEGVRFVSIKPISDTDYMVTVPNLSFNEMKANFKARQRRVVHDVQPNDWLSVIDKAEAEYSELVNEGFDFSAQVVGEVEFADTAEFVQQALSRSYRLKTTVEDIGDAGYGNEAYVISFSA